MAEFKKYRCLECEHVYDEAIGDPDSGLALVHYGLIFQMIGRVQFAEHRKVSLS